MLFIAHGVYPLPIAATYNATMDTGVCGRELKIVSMLQLSFHPFIIFFNATTAESGDVCAEAAATRVAYNKVLGELKIT